MTTTTSEAGPMATWRTYLERRRRRRERERVALVQRDEQAPVPRRRVVAVVCTDCGAWMGEAISLRLHTTHYASVCQDCRDSLAVERLKREEWL